MNTSVIIAIATLAFLLLGVGFATLMLIKSVKAKRAYENTELPDIEEVESEEETPLPDVEDTAFYGVKRNNSGDDYSYNHVTIDSDGAGDSGDGGD